MKNPNIILVLIDDLGYGDVSCFNPQSKIPTPNLERLAQMDGCGDVGRVVDQLTRDKMLALRQSVVGPWAAHYMARTKRGD